jgi:GT2 family glycosyltransferase
MSRHKNWPRVDVIIPTYRRPAMLRRAVESVLNQTYTSLHLTVVDDNNPGTQWRRETSDVMASYAANRRVEYVQHTHHRNGSAARNSGLARIPSSSTYVTFLDDDEFTLGRIQRLVDYLETEPSHVGGVWTDFIEVEDGTRNRGSQAPSEPAREFFLGNYMPGGTSNLLFKAAVVRSLCGFDARFVRLQDRELCARFLLRSHMGYVPEPLLLYHQDGPRNTPSPTQLAEVTSLFLSTFHHEMTRLGIVNVVGKRHWLSAASYFLEAHDWFGASRCLTLARNFGPVTPRESSSSEHEWPPATTDWPDPQ